MLSTLFVLLQNELPMVLSSFRKKAKYVQQTILNKLTYCQINVPVLNNSPSAGHTRKMFLFLHYFHQERTELIDWFLGTPSIQCILYIITPTTTSKTLNPLNSETMLRFLHLRDFGNVIHEYVQSRHILISHHYYHTGVNEVLKMSIKSSLVYHRSWSGCHKRDK